MTSFIAKLRGMPQVYKMSATRISNVEEACKLVQSSFEIQEPLEAKIYGGLIPSHAKLSMYTIPDDTIVFSRKDRQPITFQYQPIAIEPNEARKFKVFTTLSYESLIKGESVDLEPSCTFQMAHDTICNYIRRQYKLSNFDVLIYLPGGILFQSGMFENFTDYVRDCPAYLYAVVTKPFPAGFKPLDQISDMVSISDPLHKFIFSPLLQSSDKGMEALACLMGYIWYNGEGASDFVSAISKFIPFDPLLASLSLLSQRYTMQAHSLLCISAALGTIFQKMDPKSQPLEASLDLATYLIYLHMKSTLPVTIFEPPFCQIGFEDYFSKYSSGQQRIPALDYRFRSTFQFFVQLPLPIEQSQINASKSAFKSLEPIKVLQLSMGKKNSICILEKDGNLLLSLGPSITKEKKYSDQYTIIDPNKGAPMEISVEKFVPDSQKDNALPPEDVKQVVIICIDCSGSMASPVFESFTRLDMARQYFTSFANRAQAFKKGSRFGLISFESSIHDLKYPSELPSDFEKAADKLEPMGATAMYAAMKKAATKLCEEERPKYPNAQMRIITMTDGGDNASGSITAFEVLNYCTTNGILVDSFITGSDINSDLVAISHLSGGVAFNYNNISEGLRVFEKEEFFDNEKRLFTLRKSSVSANEYNEKKRIYMSLLNVGLVFRNSTTSNNVFEILTAMSNDESTIKVSKMVSPAVIHSIMRELIKIQQANSEDIYVYPQTDNFLVWKALIKGPEGSNYDGRWFLLSIEFGENYPQHPPEIRFTNSPFHVNISNTGKICLDLLDQTYSADKSVLFLLGAIRQLLLMPNFNSPIDSDRIGFANEKDKASYEKNIAASNAKASRASVKEWTNEWTIKYNNNAEKRTSKVIEVPLILQCQECQRLFKDPVKVSSGNVYCRRCVEAIINTKGSICPVTGKLIDANDAKKPTETRIADMVNRFIRDNGYTEN